ncbi:MAG: error-prone DNA polymerase, partial [Planctomycetes bacterium]|nr:error-prone DNA polymerase [Planctomycetota bacterium]
AAQPFRDLDDFRRRTALDKKQLAMLAEIGALEAFTSDRREALWAVWRPADGAGALALRDANASPRFRPLDVMATVTWDYRAGHHSARGHPLEALRGQLQKLRLLDALAVGRLRDGAGAQTAGLVICRQRPGTAKGVVFMTLEDETGFVNVVVWQDTYEKFAALIKTASFLAVAGRLQQQDGVVHLVAKRFWVPAVSTRPESGGSRDFH